MKNDIFTEITFTMEILLAISILPIHEHGMPFQLFLQFLSSVRYSFQCTNILPPGLILYLSVLIILVLL